METVILLIVSILTTALVLLVLFNVRTRTTIERYVFGSGSPVTTEVFRRSMAGVLDADFTEGNKITTYVDGDAIFSSMLDAIRQAKVSITFESYVWSSGGVSQAFIEALSERARAGVRVHLLMDWLGSVELLDEHYDLIKRAGIKVAKYRALSWHTLPRLNNRSHRKILVIDGTVGFTGGAGIADEWRYGKKNVPPWHDIHYRLEGPIVAKLQAAFLENWLKSHANVLEGERYFPILEKKGNLVAQAFTSSADGIEAVRLMYMLSIAAAKTSIRIMNAYFVPDVALTRALVQAAHRGVKVEIIVPGRVTDHPILQEVSRSSWSKLLRARIDIYEYQPTMHHGKIFIVDDAWVSIGSANCDGRSFRINDEMNVNVLDASFAAQQIKIFEADKLFSKLITFKAWKKRSFWRKIIGHVGRVVQGQF